MINISFVELTKKFPKDTLWVSGCLEIIGYSAKENLHIVIEDGNCRSGKEHKMDELVPYPCIKCPFDSYKKK